MLHYSNASSIEKNRRYLVIKGGLAWLFWQVGGVVFDVVEHTPRPTSTGVEPPVLSAPSSESLAGTPRPDPTLVTTCVMYIMYIGYTRDHLPK